MILTNTVITNIILAGSKILLRHQCNHHHHQCHLHYPHHDPDQQNHHHLLSLDQLHLLLRLLEEILQVLVGHAKISIMLRLKMTGETPEVHSDKSKKSPSL